MLNNDFEKKRAGRYIAYHDEAANRWEVRVIAENGKFGMPANGPVYCSSYSDCLAQISRYKRIQEAVKQPLQY